MLGDQAAGRARGVGRYTRGLVSRLIAGTDHDFILYYHRGLERTRELVADSHGARCDTKGIGRAGDSLHLAIEQIAVTNPDRLDLLLLTCPLENYLGYIPPFPAGGRLKLAAILYDLIPLIYPNHYLHHPGIARAYRRAVCALRQYDLLVAISDAGRSDALRLLKLSADRVINIAAGSDEGHFRPAASDADRRADTSKLVALGIREPFIFSLTALDFRKNLAGLLAAVECLPSDLRESHQIVLACAASNADDMDKVRSILEHCSISHRVTLLEQGDDATLRALYRRAAAFVFASRYEGFGLPLLEAMQCGAVVVAGNNSSQIEVVGDAGLLAEVDCPTQFAAAVTKVLTDKALATQLRDRALLQSQRFSWRATAERCDAALRAACVAPRSADRLRVWRAKAGLALAERMTRLLPFALPKPGRSPIPPMHASPHQPLCSSASKE